MHSLLLRRGSAAAAAAGGGHALAKKCSRHHHPSAVARARRDTANASPSRARRRTQGDDDLFDDPGRQAVARRRAAEAAEAAAARRQRAGGGGEGAAAGAPTAAATPTTSTTTRLKLVVAYDGTAFAGFQFQKPGVRTVQGELERALARVLPLRGRLVGAGRTDGGAHARAMPCHVDVALDEAAGAPGDEGDKKMLDLAALHLNGHLPPDVKVVSLERAPAGLPRAAAAAAAAAEDGEGAKGSGGSDDDDEGEEGQQHEEGRGKENEQEQQQEGKDGPRDEAGADAAAAAAPRPPLPFDAQACAVGKEYHYLFSVSARPDPFDEGARRWWAYDRYSEANRGRPASAAAFASLDFDAMRRALRGIADGAPRDFTALSDNKRPSGLGAAKRKRPKLARLAEQGLLGPRPERTSARNTRTLSASRCEVVDEGGGRARLVLVGDGFLYHQVRVTAAALLEVGQGRLSVEAFLRGVERRDRSFGAGGGGGGGGGGGSIGSAFETAPACGLFLVRVFYPGDGFE